jgi:predicted choloylglycine hydrolase
MNEHGLAVGMMAVPHGEGGNDPGKPTLGELGVIRLLLDNARSVDEALALLDGYNVDFGSGPPIHYLIADRSGAAAVVELIGDQKLVTRNSDPWLVSTNFLIAEEKPDGADSSCSRYNHAYTQLEAADGKINPAKAMSILSKVSQNGDYPTIWSVVYDLKRGIIQVAIRRDYEHFEEFQLKMK